MNEWDDAINKIKEALENTIGGQDYEYGWLIKEMFLQIDEKLRPLYQYIIGKVEALEEGRTQRFKIPDSWFEETEEERLRRENKELKEKIQKFEDARTGPLVIPNNWVKEDMENET